MNSNRDSHQPERLPRWLLPALAASLSLVLLSATALYFLRLNAAPKPGDIGRMPAFELTNQAGQRVRSADLQGKLLVIGLIFTNCTDICPTTTMQMRTLQDRMREVGLLGTDALLLSITVDPERDTPDVLARYAQQYSVDTATWHFLTGPLDYVRKVVVEGLYLGFDKVPPKTEHSHAHGQAGHAQPSYEVAHSDRLLLVDRQGVIRAVYSATELDLAKVMADLRAIR